MSKKISELDAVTSADAADVFPLVDISANKTVKMTRTNLSTALGVDAAAAAASAAQSAAAAAQADADTAQSALVAHKAGGAEHPGATTLVAGFLSAADKSKLDGITPGATVGPTLSSATPAEIAATGSAGAGTSAARDTHTHAHGTQAGGTLHAAATTSLAGFMSSADKSKLDGIAAGATVGPTLSSTPPAPVGAAAAVGVGTTAARADHVHPVALLAPIIESGTTRTLTAADHGRTIIYTGATGCAVTVPHTLAPGHTTAHRQRGAGVVFFSGSGGLAVTSEAGYKHQTYDVGALAVVTVESVTVAALDGSLGES